MFLWSSTGRLVSCFDLSIIPALTRWFRTNDKFGRKRTVQVCRPLLVIHHLLTRFLAGSSHCTVGMCYASRGQQFRMYVDWTYRGWFRYRVTTFPITCYLNSLTPGTSQYLVNDSTVVQCETQPMGLAVRFL